MEGLRENQPQGPIPCRRRCPRRDGHDVQNDIGLAYSIFPYIPIYSHRRFLLAKYVLFTADRLGDNSFSSVSMFFWHYWPEKWRYFVASHEFCSEPALTVHSKAAEHANE